MRLNSRISEPRPLRKAAQVAVFCAGILGGALAHGFSESPTALSSAQLGARVGSAAMAEPVYEGADLKLCKATAEVMVLRELGVKHWWLKSPDFERGLGGDSQKILGLVPNPFGVNTEIVTHHGQSENEKLKNRSCQPVSEIRVKWAHESKQCLQDKLETRRQTGTWVPFWNDCQTVIRDVLDECSRPAPK